MVISELFQRGNYIDAGAINKINEEYIKNNYADTTYK